MWGYPEKTIITELVLLTSAMKYNQLHSSGWLGFKPSAYLAPVSGAVCAWTSPARIYACCL